MKWAYQEARSEKRGGGSCGVETEGEHPFRKNVVLLEAKKKLGEGKVKKVKKTIERQDEDKWGLERTIV